MTAVTVVALIAAVAAPLGAYLIAARQFSGRIETSDATDLWEESRAIRDWSRQELEALRDRIRSLEDELRRCHRRIAELEGRPGD